MAYKTVLETYVNETTELVHVYVNGEEIQATPSHPFYVPKFGWTKAINLRAGDILVLSNGEYVIVEAIQHEILESPIKVYNFEVEDFHTYFVGGNCVLVHNTCPPDAESNATSNVTFESSQDKTSTNSKYWKNSIEFEGNKVYQRDDLFDPNRVSSWKEKGKTVKGTNIERMASGRAPIGYDGKSVNLHHVSQTPNGSIAELSQTFHQKYYSKIHHNTGQMPSLIDRNEFNKWKSKYWTNRALDFI